ncbi:hypothetical protein HYV81_02875 [Candidatus Woesearchaeota archaeon]|nr:hypothetical protein [Candidatus Woesearchaeota archaeon]
MKKYLLEIGIVRKKIKLGSIYKNNAASDFLGCRHPMAVIPTRKELDEIVARAEVTAGRR